MKKRRVLAGGTGNKCHGLAETSGESGTTPSESALALMLGKKGSVATGVPTLDLEGFDLTDFARFLREAAPDWVAKATKPSPVGHP